MSLRDFMLSIELAGIAGSDDYYALVMAALRVADNENEEKLKAAWPEVYDEFQKRYNAPGGMFPGEVNPDLEVGMDEDGNIYQIVQQEEVAENE